MNEYYTGHKSISTNEYTVAGRNLDLKTILSTNRPTYVKQYPYVSNDGIYVPCEEYVEEGCSSAYKCILTREMFIEAYNKWIKEEVENE